MFDKDSQPVSEPRATQSYLLFINSDTGSHLGRSPRAPEEGSDFSRREPGEPVYASWPSPPPRHNEDPERNQWDFFELLRDAVLGL